MKSLKTICELFAGVGGFRLGLGKSGWRTIYSNQWEPKRKDQYASECYISHFGKEGHTNIDIAKEKYNIPPHDLLVGGFPCQDYSVAATNAKGIKGKKGVLWWEIYHILESLRPPLVLLENVDRLLRSPSNKRGRDFGVILSCLNNLDYNVEWRVINSSDYGFPQRRFRVFILASLFESPLKNLYENGIDKYDIIEKNGFFGRAFPVQETKYKSLTLNSLDENVTLTGDLVKITEEFKYDFHNAGLMLRGNIYTKTVNPILENQHCLGEILENEVDEYYYLPEEEIDSWKYHKGAKNEIRTSKSGYSYNYKEGAITFPDRLDRPSRTLITNEGNKKPNRFTHVLRDPENGRLRIITPLEAERLNGFPDSWTDTGMPLKWRYFCMGNALVVGLIERIGQKLSELLENGVNYKYSDSKVIQRV